MYPMETLANNFCAKLNCIFFLVWRKKLFAIQHDRIIISASFPNKFILGQFHTVLLTFEMILRRSKIISNGLFFIIMKWMYCMGCFHKINNKSRNSLFVKTVHLYKNMAGCYILLQEPRFYALRILCELFTLP